MMVMPVECLMAMLWPVKMFTSTVPEGNVVCIEILFGVDSEPSFERTMSRGPLRIAATLTSVQTAVAKFDPNPAFQLSFRTRLRRAMY